MQDAPTFFIRDIPVYGDAILSPMDGYSDLPFRALCRGLGSALSYTEFINALEILNGHPYVHRRYQFLPSERPVVFQIFDNDPDRLVRTAQILRQYEPDIIDINMGCSARGVAARGAGAGLLRTPLKIARTFRRLTRLLDIPVTGKIRLGWDDATRNYCLVARIIEQEGGAMVAVHGRTKVQAYSGNADWDAIAEVRQAVSIPVVANGDVRTAADIERLKNHTGCSAVMIGRAAISNPWIFSHRERHEISSDEVRAAVQQHLQLSLEFYGARRGIVLFRKYAARYLNPTGELRQRMLTTYDPQELLACVELALN